MVTQSEWNAFAGGMAATAILQFVVWAVWHASIEPAIARHRYRKEERLKERAYLQREQIRAAVAEALGTGDEDELDPDDFAEDDSTDLPDGSTRHPA